MSAAADGSTVPSASSTVPASADAASERFSSGMCGLGRCIGFTNLKACSACNVVFYCSREHQTEHWKAEGHKIVCKGRKEGKAPSFDELAATAQRFAKTGAWRLALMNFGAMLELTEQQLDNTYHPQCALILEQMATCYKGLDQYANAIHTYTRVLLIRDFNNETNDAAKCADAYRVMGMWAECFLQLGQFDLARDAFKKIEQTAIQYFGENSSQRGQAFQALGTVYVELGQWKEAEVAYKLALSLEAYSTQHFSAGCHYNLGVLLSAQDRHGEASKEFQLSIDKKSKANPDDKLVQEARDCLALASKGEKVPGCPVLPPPVTAASGASEDAAAVAVDK